MSSNWDGSNRRARLPSNWGKLRAQVLERDGHRCRWPTEQQPGTRCGAAATEVDHIKAGDDHSLDNLQALCRWHHQRKSSSEGQQSPNRQTVTMSRPPEQHPGLL